MCFACGFVTWLQHDDVVRMALNGVCELFLLDVVNDISRLLDVLRTHYLALWRWRSYAVTRGGGDTWLGCVACGVRRLMGDWCATMPTTTARKDHATMGPPRPTTIIYHRESLHTHSNITSLINRTFLGTTFVGGVWAYI